MAQNTVSEQKCGYSDRQESTVTNSREDLAALSDNTCWLSCSFNFMTKNPLCLKCCFDLRIQLIFTNIDKRAHLPMMCNGK